MTGFRAGRYRRSLRPNHSLFGPAPSQPENLSNQRCRMNCSCPYGASRKSRITYCCLKSGIQRVKWYWMSQVKRKALLVAHMQKVAGAGCPDRPHLDSCSCTLNTYGFDQSLVLNTTRNSRHITHEKHSSRHITHQKHSSHQNRHSLRTEISAPFTKSFVEGSARKHHSHPRRPQTTSPFTHRGPGVGAPNPTFATKRYLYTTLQRCFDR
jgi:hypothetical protein